MTISRRKLISALSALLGISLVPSLAIAMPVQDLVIGKSVDFMCSSVIRSKVNLIEDAINLLEVGFEVYDEDHGTHSIGQAKAVIDLTFRNQEQLDFIRNICSDNINKRIGLWVSVNLTKGTSESGFRLID